MSSILTNDNFFCEEILKRLPPQKINDLLCSSSTLFNVIRPHLPELKTHMRSVNKEVNVNQELRTFSGDTIMKSVLLNDGNVYSKETLYLGNKILYFLYRNSKRHGPTTKYLNGKLEHLLTFKDDMKHGIELKYDIEDNNEILTCQRMYKNDQLDGKTIIYNKRTGSREITEYKNGLRDGRYEKWARNDKLIKDGNFHKNKKDGIFNTWDSYGRIVKSHSYTKDRIDTKMSF